MRPSGTYMLHSWRVLITDDGYRALIDGVDRGKMMASDLETAAVEIKLMIFNMVQDGQK